MVSAGPGRRGGHRFRASEGECVVLAHVANGIARATPRGKAHGQGIKGDVATEGDSPRRAAEDRGVAVGIVPCHRSLKTGSPVPVGGRAIVPRGSTARTGSVGDARDRRAIPPAVVGGCAGRSRAGTDGDGGVVKERGIGIDGKICETFKFTAQRNAELECSCGGR